MSIYSITSPIEFTPAPTAPEQAIPAFTDTRKGVIDMIRESLNKGNKLATFVGLLFAAAPVASYEVKHFECSAWNDPKMVIVLAGVLFSFPTVYAWLVAAFHNKWKAFGLALFLESILCFSDCHWLVYADLAALVGINGVAAGSYLAADQHFVRLANWITSHQVAAVPVIATPIAALVGSEAPSKTRKPRRKTGVRKPRRSATEPVVIAEPVLETAVAYFDTNSLVKLAVEQEVAA